MMKYNVGDKVRVRSDLSAIHGAVGTMIRLWAGKDVTIDAVDRQNESYTIKEDNHPFKYVWGDEMFEGYASATTEDGKMPKLTTGMFGTIDGFEKDVFVIVNDHLVFKDGLCEAFDELDENGSCDTYWIDALYEAVCFNEVEDGNAKLIWKRPEKVKDVKEVKETKEEPTKKPTEDDTDDVIAFLDFLATLAKFAEHDEKKDKTA